MKKELLKFVILLAVALGANHLNAAVWQWSTSADNNGNADPAINFKEGQSPSSLNDSARALMAQIALWRRDFGAFQVTGGTASAYTITSNEGFTSAASMDGATFNFFAHTPNAANAVLNVDGIGNFPIDLSIGNPVPAGVFQTLGNYSVVFNAGNGEFLVQGYYASSFNIPLGGYLFSSVGSAPNANFLLANGACISTTTYAAYFAVVGTAYGTCGSGTFALPDLRGRVPAALDGGAGRLTSSAAGCGTTFNALGAVCANGTESKNLSIANLNSFTPTGTFSAALSGGAAPVPQQGNSNIGSPITSAFSEGGNNKSATVLNVAVSGSVSGSVSMNSLGSGTASPTVPPVFAINVFVRVI